MKRRGPLLTLLAVVGLAVVLLFVNMSRESKPTAQDTSPKATQSASAAPDSTAPPATAAPPAAAPATPFPAKADYVGEIPIATGVITLATTVEGNRAVAYACDGKTVESWLSGTANGGVLNLTGKGDARLEGRYDGTAVSGTLWIGGKSWTFTTAPAEPPAGLYVVGDTSTTRVSWIVGQDGDVTGVLRDSTGATSPAPALSKDGTAVVGGTTVTADAVSGNDEIG